MKGEDDDQEDRYERESRGEKDLPVATSGTKKEHDSTRPLVLLTPPGYSGRLPLADVAACLDQLWVR